jgi:hypothetical protein
LNHTELLYCVVEVDACKWVLNFLGAILVPLVLFELSTDLSFVGVAGGVLVVALIAYEIVLAVLDS